MPRKGLKTKKRVNDCSAKGIIKKFKELKYMTDIPHTISTGNKSADKIIGKYGSAVVGLAVKNPVLKLGVKGAGKVYPYVEDTFANLARAKMAYEEACKRRK